MFLFPIRIKNPAWFPNAALSSILKPQTLENSVLRVATGCIKMTSIVLLHEETKVLPIQDHLSLQCSQYLARTVQPNNLPFRFQKPEIYPPILVTPSCHPVLTLLSTIDIIKNTPRIDEHIFEQFMNLGVNWYSNNESIKSVSAHWVTFVVIPMLLNRIS